MLSGRSYLSRKDELRRLNNGISSVTDELDKFQLQFDQQLELTDANDNKTLDKLEEILHKVDQIWDSCNMIASKQSEYEKYSIYSECLSERKRILEKLRLDNVHEVYVEAIHHEDVIAHKRVTNQMIGCIFFGGLVMLVYVAIFIR